MSPVKRVLVVGSGVAGLAAALATARAGIEVEIAGKPATGRLGQTHVNVAPNMLRGLMDLGVAEACLHTGFPYVETRHVDLRGGEYFRDAVTPLTGTAGPSALGMTHHALCAQLWQAAQGAGAIVRPAACLDRIEEAADEVSVCFEDGDRRSYDLVVGADGAQSQLRAHRFDVDGVPREVGQVWWQVQLRRPRTLDTPTILVGGFHGFRAAAVPVSKDRASLLLIEMQGAAPEVPPACRAGWIRDRLKPCSGVIAEMREQLGGSEPVLVQPVRAGLVPDRWHRGRVLLVGEAAHVIPPQLGQAAAQCIEDATVLGSVLRNSPALDAMFSEFMRRRYERCRNVYEASLQVAHWELRPDPAADIQAMVRRQALAVSQPA